jgi:hypothetical protein
MKFSILASLMTIATIATSMQSASAQESRGARFNFAPNVWKSEGVRMPKGYGNPDPVHAVRAGAVPSGNLLGVDPSMLSKPAPPPVVAAAPVMTSVTPAMFVPKTNANFNPMFGKPQVAQLPAPVPQQAVAMPMTTKPLVARSAPAGKRHVNTAVGGRLLTPTRRYVAPTSATPAVASYPTNFGYSPGPLLPSSGNGVSASTKLSGVILGRKHK